MKKLISLLLAALLLTAAGCSKKKENNSAPDTVSVNSAESDYDSGTEFLETSDTNVGETAGSTDTVPSDAELLPSYTESFVNKNSSVTLVYPRFGDGLHDLFDISIRNYALKKYNESGIMPEEGAVYEVTLMDVTYVSDTLVSAVFAGHIIDSGAAHDGYFSYTVNADPSTGRIYLSEELIGDLDALKSGIASGDFVQSYGIPNVLDEINAEDMTRSWREDYGIFPYMYFREGKFGVLAELPYAIGGYAGFEISLESAQDMINDTAKALAGEQ